MMLMMDGKQMLMEAMIEIVDEDLLVMMDR
jgi:hypothetical protein